MTSNSKMKILIIEDDIDDCNSFRTAVNKRNDIEIVATTDSDIEAIQLICKSKTTRRNSIRYRIK